MIFVDFPDAAAAESTTSLYNLLVPAATQWYANSSYGRVSLDVSAVHSWFRMPKSATSYDFARGLTYEKHRAYIADAVHAADASVDFSKYDLVYIVAADSPAISFSPTFNVFAGGGVAADGTEIRNAVTFGQDIRFPRWGAHVFEHETGHIFGLPDLYDFSRSTNFLEFVGGWDTLSWVEPGAEFVAWEKWKLGWLDPAQLRCLSTSGQMEETMSPLESAGGIKALVVPTSTSAAYVVEVRQATGGDAGLCDHGVLLYTVDAKTATGAGPIRVIGANSGSDPTQLEKCGPLYDAPFDVGPGERTTFENATLKLEVLATDGASYRVRLTRK
jgi:M6 family metalloprotease-like protein